MDVARTPPRGVGEEGAEEGEEGEDAEEQTMPLRDRMRGFHDEFLEAHDLVHKVAPGLPRVTAPHTIAEAFDLANEAANKAAAKAKENVSVV